MTEAVVQRTSGGGCFLQSMGMPLAGARYAPPPLIRHAVTRETGGSRAPSAHHDPVEKRV